jgi:hypothetical protein
MSWLSKNLYISAQKKAMLRDWGNDEERAKPILLSELEKLCNGLDLRTRQDCRADAYLKIMFYTEA